MMGMATGLLRLAQGRPFLLVSVALLLATLWYREQYNDEIKARLERQAAAVSAEVEAREIAQERQYQFAEQQLERLEREREELERQRGLEQAALAERARMVQMADALLEDKLEQIDALKAEHESLRDRVPDAAVRLFEPSARAGNGNGS